MALSLRGVKSTMTNALLAKNYALTGPATTGSLDQYLQTIGQIPILTRKEEQGIARRLRDDNDLEAARTLVVSHLRFVVHIAKGYTGYGLPIGDLIQEGNVGLMKAVKRFDPEVGVRLVSFAVHWIRAEIHEFILRNWRLVKVATTKAQRKLFFNLRKAKKNLNWLSADEAKAVADDLGVSTREVHEMEKRLSAHDISLDPAPGASDEESFSPTSYLPSPTPDPAQLIEKEDWDQQSSLQLTDAMQLLDDRSRGILQRRWLVDKKETLHDLADEYGVSAERIRQIEVAAIAKLRKAMAA